MSFLRGADRLRIASSFLLGLTIPSLANAQQPPVWSPQPYARSQEPTIPENKLRTSTEPATTLRWSRVEGAKASQVSPYSQVFHPVTSQQSDANVQLSSGNDNLVIRQPKSSKFDEYNRLANREARANQPATGWDMSQTSQSTRPSESTQLAAESTKVQTSAKNNLLQLASSGPDDNEPPRMKNWPLSQQTQKTMAMTTASGAASSSRRDWQGVQKASFQEETDLDDLPKGRQIPDLPEPAGAGKSLLPNSPPSLDLSPLESPQTKENASPSDRKLKKEENQLEDVPRKTPPPAPRPQRAGINCETLRQAIEETDIRKIDLDTSPKFVEGYRSNKATSSKESFVRSAPMREWYGVDGTRIAYGKLVDMVKGKVIIETAEGQRVSFLYNRLSNPDLAYVSDAWGVPVLCALSDGSIEPRQFAETTMTFKASGACHKPLYFEEPQLERYGHEWGPIVHPFISTANFVKNVAVLPYKMGIHPMNECQYPVGYYRPGSCAPWTVGPVPISLRGALMQAGAVTGASLALP